MARRNDDYDWLDDPFDGCLAALGLAVLAVVATVAALGSLSL